MNPLLELEKKLNTELDTKTQSNPAVEEDPSIIRGYDQVESNLASEKEQFDGWLNFRVQNNIVTQLFESNFTIQGVMDVNINAIATELEREIEKEKTSRFELAQKIEHEYIPAANVRQESNHVHDYLPSNVSELYDRVEINIAMADHLTSLQPQEGEDYYDKALQRADKVFKDAQAEAAAILQQTIEQKEEEIRQAKAKIAEMNALRASLLGQIAETPETTEKDESVDFAREVSHLTEEAKSLAA